MGILDQLFSGSSQSAGGGLFSGGLLAKMGSNQPPTPQNALLDKMGLGNGNSGFRSLMGKQGQANSPHQTLNQGYFPPAPQQQLPLQQFLQSLIK